MAGVQRLYYRFVNPDLTTADCLLGSALMMLGIQMSQVTTFAIAVDRLHAVFAPLSYYQKDHRSYAINCAWATLCYALIPTLLLFVGLDLESKPPRCNVSSICTRAFNIYWSVFSIGIAVVIFASYGVVLVLTKRWLKHVADQQSVFAQRVKAQAKLTRTISFIIFFYLLLWFAPNIAFNIGVWLHVSPLIQGMLGPFVPLGVGLNSGVNVFIYALIHKDFQECTLKLLKFGMNPGNQVHAFMPPPNQ